MMEGGVAHNLACSLLCDFVIVLSIPSTLRLLYLKDVRMGKEMC